MLLSVALEFAGSQLWGMGCDAKWFSQKSAAFGSLFHFSCFFLSFFLSFFFYLLFAAVLGLPCACEGFLSLQ